MMVRVWHGLVSLGRDIVTTDILASTAKSVVESRYSTYGHVTREQKNKRGEQWIALAALELLSSTSWLYSPSES